MSLLGSNFRHARFRQRSAVRSLLVWMAAGLTVLIVSAGSVATIATWDVLRSASPSVHLSQLPGSTRNAIDNVAAVEGGVNLLLVGTDTRTGQGGVYTSKAEQAGSSGAGNNDVTMLLHIAQDHKSMVVISFPRDLILPVPACPTANGGTVSASRAAMMNTTLARGGLSCVALTVSKLTGLQIPFAAEISFNGVTAMSNAVGGVTVCLATRVDDLYTTPPLHLTAGQQTLIGDKALSFLRSRHGVGDGSDLGRISNQQVFMSALARKIESGGVLTNPLQLYPLAKAAVGNMVLSDTLTDPTTLVQIGLALKDTGLGNMVFLQYPTTADPADQNRVIVDKSAATILNTALVADKALTLTGKPGRASVDATPAPSPSGSPTPSLSPSPSASGSPTPSSSGPVVLPSTISGQTAAQETCTVGNR